LIGMRIDADGGELVIHVPNDEPATLGLLAVGGLVTGRRRRRNAFA